MCTLGRRTENESIGEHQILIFKIDDDETENWWICNPQRTFKR